MNGFSVTGMHYTIVNISFIFMSVNQMESEDSKMTENMKLSTNIIKLCVIIRL